VSDSRDPNYAPEEDPRLAELGQSLDRLAADQRSVARDAEALADAPGLERVGGILEAAWREDARDGDVRTRRWVFQRRAFWIGVSGIAAAAVLIVALTRGAPEVDPGVAPFDEPSDVYLNTGELELAPTTTNAAGWTVLRWGGREEASYQLTIRNADTGRELMPPTVVLGREFPLDPETTHAWPATLYLIVEMTPPDGRRESITGTVRR